MPKSKPAVKKLYANHLKDIQSIDPSFTEFVICPLCKQQLNKSNGNVGHVWPNYIRDKAENPQPVALVLLCKSCNTRMARFGETHMQQFEKAKDGIAERPLEIYIPGPKGPRFRFRGKMTGIQDNTIDSLTLNYKNMSQDKRAQVRQLIGTTKVPMKVHLPRDGSAPIARAGWVQAAYLTAFYTLGYRYVFQSSVQPVYDYIQNSYHKSSDALYASANNSATSIYENKEFNIVGHPLIELMIPLNSDVPFTLRVSLLNYHIHLPIECDKAKIDLLLRQECKNIDRLRSEWSKDYEAIGFEINCNKSKAQMSVWDQILQLPEIPRPNAISASPYK